MSESTLTTHEQIADLNRKILSIQNDILEMKQSQQTYEVKFLRPALIELVRALRGIIASLESRYGIISKHIVN